MFQRVLFTACVLALPVGAHADVLYSQPFDMSSARVSEFAPTGGFRTIDDFEIFNSVSVESVTFRGLWLGPETPAPAPAPDATSWDMGFFTDNGGVPGAAIASQIIGAGSVSLAPVVTGEFGFGGPERYNVVVYDLTVTLPTAVTLAAHTRYWFSPLALSSQYEPWFGWLGSANPSGTGNDVTKQIRLNAQMQPTEVIHVGRDRAFRLEGTVPEPASLTLLGLAGAAVLVRRRRAR